MAFVSGQVVWDHQHDATAGTVGVQFDRALAKLTTVLETVGASVDDLLHVRISVLGELPDHLGVLASTLSAFLGTSRRAVTGVEVASLAMPETHVEIQAVAGVRVAAREPTAGA